MVISINFMIGLINTKLNQPKKNLKTTNESSDKIITEI